MSLMDGHSESAETHLPASVPGSRASGKMPGWARRPVVRLAVMVVLFVLVDGVTNAINGSLTGIPVLALLVGLATAAAALWVYGRAIRVTEHREAGELERSTAWSGLRIGVVTGLALFAVTIGVIAVFGGYRLTGWGSLGAAVAAVGMTSCVAVTEELLFRGVVFRLVEEMVGSRGALIFSAVLFGALHLINPDATIWGALAIAIEAGLMLGAAYLATRSLWLPIGLHLGWNLAEGGIFATTVSGSSTGETGLFHSVLHGSTALTGGSFGPEASVVAILVCAVPTLYFLRSARRQGSLRSRGTSADTLAA
jgi:membrane protease YdiL (CAAX protease family)